MSGVGFSELIILALIGLIVLGPERLPRVAKQLGDWIGQARRMTRVMRRQLEDELNLDKDLNINPMPGVQTPFDDDTYSPQHAKKPKSIMSPAVAPPTAPVEPPAAADSGENDGSSADDVATEKGA